MLGYKYKTPFILKYLFPECEWKVKTKDKKIYLTFDDGPVPDVTEYVLEVLKKYDCKATFFCVGENIYRNPGIYKKLVAEGHQTGNHTYHHLNGWSTDTEDYIRNVQLCQEVMDEALRGRLPAPGHEDVVNKAAPGFNEPVDNAVKRKSGLFRPPYGKIKKSQTGYLKNHYRIIMWDLLTRDFDRNEYPHDCLKAAVKYTEEGSIVIFHDSVKAEKVMRNVLPQYIEICLERGFSFLCL